MNGSRHSIDQRHLRDTAQLLGQLLRQTHQTVLGNRRDINRVRELAVKRVAVNVLRDQSLRFGQLDGQHCAQEVNHFASMILRRIVEIESTVLRLDSECVFVRLVLQHQLLQIVERLLVLRPLANLHQAGPKVLGLSPMAVVAHLIVDDELDDEHLLEHGSPEHFLVDGQFDL